MGRRKTREPPLASLSGSDRKQWNATTRRSNPAAAKAAAAGATEGTTHRPWWWCLRRLDPIRTTYTRAHVRRRLWSGPRAGALGAQGRLLSAGLLRALLVVTRACTSRPRERLEAVAGGGRHSEWEAQSKGSQASEREEHGAAGEAGGYH